MCSLKSKIRERVTKNQEFIDRHKNALNIASRIVEGENNSLKWVLGLLDEATKPFRKIKANLDKVDSPHTVMSVADFQRLINQVLAVLEGERK